MFTCSRIEEQDEYLRAVSVTDTLSL